MTHHRSSDDSVNAQLRAGRGLPRPLQVEAGPNTRRVEARDSVAAPLVLWSLCRIRLAGTLRGYDHHSV